MVLGFTSDVAEVDKGSHHLYGCIKNQGQHVLDSGYDVIQVNRLTSVGYLKSGDLIDRIHDEIAFIDRVDDRGQDTLWQNCSR